MKVHELRDIQIFKDALYATSLKDVAIKHGLTSGRVSSVCRTIIHRIEHAHRAKSLDLSLPKDNLYVIKNNREGWIKAVDKYAEILEKRKQDKKTKFSEENELGAKILEIKHHVESSGFIVEGIDITFKVRILKTENNNQIDHLFS